ncbi:MAG: GNAT family N-acetyltransferase, partial [Candidatus Eisenbacteria sp.]|nr:GNAT family N-acetyltransferase [Candidatus Eisenbacteria bacterium]
IGFGFEQLGLHRIWATCDTGNAQSARVLERAGMALEGTMRDDTWLRGHWRSSHLYSILESEWSPGERRDPAGSGEAHGPAGSGRARREEERR